MVFAHSLDFITYIGALFAFVPTTSKTAHDVRELWTLVVKILGAPISILRMAIRPLQQLPRTVLLIPKLRL